MTTRHPAIHLFSKSTCAQRGPFFWRVFTSHVYFLSNRAMRNTHFLYVAYYLSLANGATYTQNILSVSSKQVMMQALRMQQGRSFPGSAWLKLIPYV